MISKEIVRLSIQITANKITVKQKWHGKRGVTPHASQIKLNSTKLNLMKWYEVIYLWLQINMNKKNKKFINLLKSQIIFLCFSEALSMCQNLWI